MDRLARLLFHELADLPPSEREKLFAERGIAPELRAEMESLLSFDSANESSLTERVSATAEEMLRSADVRAPGQQCGPYRLVRLLGAGGMGAVYLAERSDGEIQQKVAIKLLHAGANRPAWRDRFRRERQLLASLNHPSIAHVLDAGHTEGSAPYLVMEYVDGVPIDAYAAEKGLREKVTLFLRVCDGVSHAHRHLIIHRDLKPSNILVDSSGQPKLLDFGIAKILDETGDPTQTVERLLTPNYASPEQLRGANQTTATDVYSLGAVLYKILTGRSPHESGAGTSQAIKLITGARDIPLPSRLNPSLPSDIDYILRRALRHEPEERYASVEALANDIGAFLDSRPVQARSGDAWYRTRKFLQRYWLPVAAVSLAIAGLSAGLWVANRERAIAQQRFVQVRQLANKLFDIDVAVRRPDGTTKARQLIVDTSLEYLRRLAEQVRGDPELALDVGNAYMRVARVQGVPIATNLGQVDQAEQNLRKAEALIHSVLAAQPGNRTAFLRAAQIAHDRMVLAEIRRPDHESLNLARQSEAWLKKYLATGKVDQSEAQAVVITAMNVANRYVMELQFDEAIRLSRLTIEIARATNQENQAGAALMVVARAHRERADLDEALRAIRECVTTLELSPGAGNRSRVPILALALIWQGEILGEDNAVSLGRSEEAVASLDRAFRITEEVARQDTDDAFIRARLADAGLSLADILRHSDPQRATGVYDHTLRRLAEVKNNLSSRRKEVRALAGSTYPLRRLGRHAEARQRLDTAFSRLSQLKLYPAGQIELGLEADDTLRALADHEADSGNIPRAIGIYQKLLDQILAANPKPETRLAEAVDLSGIYAAVALLHRRSGRAELASPFEERRLELWRQWDRKLPRNAFVRRQLDAASLRQSRVLFPQAGG